MTTVHFRTYGCSLNQADSEIMMGLLQEVGFRIVDEPRKAEVIIVNTCTVKQPTETKFFRELEELKKCRRPIVIAGCIPEATAEKLDGYSLIGPDHLTRIVEAVEETMHHNQVRFLGPEHLSRPGLPKIRRNPVVEIIPICSGCLGSCTYCIVKRTRGSLHSYDSAALVHQAEQALKDGAKELWLTAQDTGCYGKDRKTGLAALLRDLVALDGQFFIRVGMMNPDHAKDMVADLISIYSHPKVFRFLHLPVQSGNNEVLKRMGRSYTVEEFIDIVRRVRAGVPDVTISTDIICGFPGETKGGFMDSVALVNTVKPEVLNISRFWPRPYTEAEKLERLPGEETKDRSRYLTEMFKWISFENNKRWRSWEGDIIIDEKGKNSTWVGRNFAYKPVIVRGDFALGQMVRVRVEHVTSHDLRAAQITH